MTQLEKAKIITIDKYEEALKRAKEFIGKEECINLEYIFPELHESEDEKIICSLKEIVTYAFSKKGNEVLVSINGLKKDDLIAWLEKQDEQEDQQKLFDIAKHQGYKEGLRDGRAEVWAQIEKQGEQKLFDYENVNIKQKDFAPKSALEAIKEEKVDNANKVEPKFKVGDTIKCTYDNRQFTIKSVDIEKGVYTYTEDGCSNNIDYADEYFELVEQKPAWSEKDEKKVVVINEAVEHYWSDDTQAVVEIQTWLKSLKDRCLPQQTEWSEEDEEMFDAIIADIQFTQKAHNHEVNQVVYEREMDWLNAHHFDHRHLIEKGLALAAPEGMYK